MKRPVRYTDGEFADHLDASVYKELSEYCDWLESCLRGHKIMLLLYTSKYGPIDNDVDACIQRDEKELEI